MAAQNEPPDPREARPVEALKLLREARELVARGWCQDTDARNVAGEPVTADSTAAVCWCMEGALRRAGQYLRTGPRIAAYWRLKERAFPADADGMMLCEYNDAPGRTQAEVLAVFDQAIRCADDPTYRLRGERVDGE